MEDGIIYVFGQLNTMVMVFDGLAYLYSSGATFFAGGNGLGLGIAATMAAVLNILMSFGSYTAENKLNMHGPLIGLSMYALIAIPTVDRVFVQDIYTGTTVAVQDVPLGIAAVAQVSSSLFFHTAEYFEDAFDNTAMHGTAFVSKVTEGNGFMSPLKTLMYLKQESINVTPKHLVYNIITYSKDCIGRSQRNGSAASVYNQNQFRYSVNPFADVFLDADYIDGTLFIQQMATDGTTSFTDCASLRTYLAANEATPGSIDNYFTDSTTYGRSLLNKLAIANEEELTACAISNGSCTTAATAITKTENIVAQVAGGNAQAKEYMKIMMANDFSMMLSASNALNSQSTADVVSSMRYSIELTRMNEAMEGEMFLHFMMKALNGFLAVVYALFPIAMIIMVLQGIKATAYFGKYIIMVFWLQSWVPVAAVINYISISNVRDAMKAIEDTSGFTVASSDAIFQSAMDAVVTGSNLLAATPLISLVILTGSYFALTSAASGTASPSGGSGAAARMSTPAPHGGSPILNMGASHSDATGTGRGVMNNANLQRANHYNSADSSVQSSEQKAVQSQQRSRQDALENSTSNAVSMVKSEIASQGSSYSYDSLSSGSQSLISAANQSYTAQTGNDNDVGTADGARTALNWAVGAGTAATSEVYSSRESGRSSGGQGTNSHSTDVDPALLDAAETVLDLSGPEGMAVSEGLNLALNNDSSPSSSGGSGGGGTQVNANATGRVTGTHENVTGATSGNKISSGTRTEDSTQATQSDQNTEADTTKAGVNSSDQTSNARTNADLETALSKMSEAYSDLQGFQNENKDTLQSSRGYSVSDGDAYSLAKEKIDRQQGGNSNEIMQNKQSNAVYDSAIDSGYSPKSAEQLKQDYNEHRADKAKEMGFTGPEATGLAGITSFATFGNNNSQHAEVMQGAQSNFEETLHPGRQRAIDPSEQKDTMDNVKGNTDNGNWDAKAASLSSPSPMTETSPSMGQSKALDSSGRFEQRFHQPSDTRQADTAANGATPQYDPQTMGDFAPSQAKKNAEADYADGATLGDAYFSDDAKNKFSQGAHGKDFNALNNAQKAEVSNSLNKSALSDVDDFLNSMQSPNSGQQSNLAEEYRTNSERLTTSQGGPDISGTLDGFAGGLISQSANNYTDKHSAAAYGQEIAGEVATQSGMANQAIVSGGTDNNANGLTKDQFEGLTNKAQEIAQANPGDMTAQQSEWNNHVNSSPELSAKPAIQSQLSIPSDDAHANRSPMGQLVNTHEMAGGEFSGAPTNVSDAVVSAGSRAADSLTDQIAGVVNSGANFAANIVGSGESSVGTYTPSGDDSFIPKFDTSSGGFASGAKEFVNGGVDKLNSTIGKAEDSLASGLNFGSDILNSGIGNVQSSVLSAADATRIDATPGTQRATSDTMRADLSNQFQNMSLSDSQRSDFNNAFNTELTKLSGQQTNVDLGQPLNVGASNQIDPVHMSDAFVSTSKQMSSNNDPSK